MRSPQRRAAHDNEEATGAGCAKTRIARAAVAAVVVVVLAVPTPTPAGWRADCRVAARARRKSRGATSTTTTIPRIAWPSQNCLGGRCIMVNGERYASMFEALNERGSFPKPPDCSLCSEFCSSATTKHDSDERDGSMTEHGQHNGHQRACGRSVGPVTTRFLSQGGVAQMARARVS
jgi:hypothetical protein